MAMATPHGGREEECCCGKSVPQLYLRLGSLGLMSKSLGSPGSLLPLLLSPPPVSPFSLCQYYWRLCLPAALPCGPGRLTRSSWPAARCCPSPLPMPAARCTLLTLTAFMACCILICLPAVIWTLVLMLMCCCLRELWLRPLICM